MSTTRPEASETTGTVRETSGLTTPVTVSEGAATCSSAATSGNWSGRLTSKTLESARRSTRSGGGASAVGSALPFSQPANRMLSAKAETAAMIEVGRFKPLLTQIEMTEQGPSDNDAGPLPVF
jgi:hypothetical protein